MRKEDLFQEIGEIDEDLIEEAAEIGDRRLHGKHYMEWIPLVAAGFVLVWVVGKTDLFQPSYEAETTAAAQITSAAAEITTAAAAESWLEDTVAPEEETAESGMPETDPPSIEMESTNQSSATGGGTETTAEESNTATEIQLPWNERDLYQQYAQFDWAGRAYAVTERELEASDLGERLASITVAGIDMESGTTHEIQAEIWLVQGLEEECALAIRYESDSRYFGAIHRGHCWDPWE